MYIYVYIYISYLSALISTMTRLVPWTCDIRAANLIAFKDAALALFLTKDRRNGEKGTFRFTTLTIQFRSISRISRHQKPRKLVFSLEQRWPGWCVLAVNCCTVPTHNRLTRSQKNSVFFFIYSLAFFPSVRPLLRNHARLNDYCESNNDDVLRVRRWRRQ